MNPSRSQRQARAKNKRTRARRIAILYTAIVLLLAAGVYSLCQSDFTLDDLKGLRQPARADAPGEHGTGHSGKDEHAAADDDRDDAHGHADPSPEGGDSAEEPAPTESHEPQLTLALVGDVMMGGRIDDLLHKHGFDYPYLHVGDLLRAADIAAGNLENPITDRGDPEEKQYTFRTHPDAVPAMADSGFDVFNLANNHTLDFGLTGLRDTIRHLQEAGLGYMGAGENEEEAFRPYSVMKHDMRVDFLGFTNVVPHVGWKAGKDRAGLAETYNYKRAVEAIGHSAEEADLVVVFVHWGIERQDTPEPYMIDNAHHYIDAGADLVIGSHPHVLGGIEYYKGKWIAYSLGNFIFTVNPNAPSKDSVILQANCERDGNCSLTLVPVVTGIGQPVLATAEESEAIFNKVSLLSIGAEVNEQGEVVALE